MTENNYKGYGYPLKVKVTRIDDPEQLNRVQVYIPSYHGEYDESLVGYSDELGEYPWAQLSSILFKDAGNFTIDSMKELFAGDLPMILPAVGTVGWAIFEGGDIRCPIYIGSLGKGLINETVEGSFTGSDNNNLSNASGGSLDVMANIIFEQEGGGKNYGNINPKDVDAISIGVLQWHADNGRELIKRIKDANTGVFNHLYSFYNATFPLDKSWAGFYVSKGDNNYNCIQALLTGNEGKQCQDEYVNEYLSTYVEQAKTVGVTDYKAQIYFCDMYNQAPSEARQIGKNAVKKDIDGLHNETLNGSYWLGSNAYHNRDRRIRVYNAVKIMDMSSALVSAVSTTISAVKSLEISFNYPTDCKEIVETFEKGKNKGIKIHEENIAGMEVRASHTGTARFLDRGSKGYGKFVEITSGKYTTRYTHLKSFSNPYKALQPSDTIAIEQGEVIGYVGRSGDANNYFLGFEVLKNGVNVDPMPYLEGVSNNYNSTNNGVIETAVNFMIDVANDNSHGYSQAHRNLDPDVDCSSLVILGYSHAGLNVREKGATYTGNMRQAFTQCGFTAIPFSVNMELVRGDVLLNEAHHTACYIGNNQMVQASISETGGIYGQGGDQTGREVYVGEYRVYSKGWDYVLRYTG